MPSYLIKRLIFTILIFKYTPTIYMIMNAEKKRYLEAKLAAVRELKSEYYIGTAEAKEYTDAIAKSETRPEYVSRSINSILGDNITYPATPQRVIGISDYIGNILSVTNPCGDYEMDGDLTGLVSKINELCHSSLFSKITNTNWHRSAVLENNEDKSLEFAEGLDDKEYIRYLAKLFNDTNRRNLSSDKELGYIAASDIINISSGLSAKPNIREYAIGAGKIIFAKSIAWNSLYPESMHFDDEHAYRIKKAVLDHEKKLVITSSNILERAMKDRVLNRIDYSRQVITKYAEELDTKDYDTVIGYAKRRLNDRRKRLQIVLKIGSGEVERHIADNERKLIQQAEEMIRLVVSEKNFLTRFLSN